jgi:hypothetical protein
MRLHRSSFVLLLGACAASALVACAHDVSLGKQSLEDAAGAAGQPAGMSECAGAPSNLDETGLPGERRCRQLEPDDADQTDRIEQDSDTMHEEAEASAPEPGENSSEPDYEDSSNSAEDVSYAEPSTPESSTGTGSDLSGAHTN